MTKNLHHFFISSDCISDRFITLTDRNQVHQIGRVLRMRPGDLLIFLDGKGDAYRVMIQSINSSSIHARIEESWPLKSESDLHIRLFQGLPKSLSKFETVLRQGTEIGISEFYPLITQNSETQEFHKRPRMEVILTEAAEQSERGKIPLLGPEILFRSLLENGFSPQLKADHILLAHSREKDVLLSSILGTIRPSASLNILIGPEGGFTENEVNTAREKGWTVFGLGPRILRTETAGLAISSVLLYGSSHAT